eukprot:5177044-Prymnesium_polylepis.1
MSLVADLPPLPLVQTDEEQYLNLQKRVYKLAGLKAFLTGWVNVLTFVRYGCVRISQIRLSNARPRPCAHTPCTSCHLRHDSDPAVCSLVRCRPETAFYSHELWRRASGTGRRTEA